MDETKNKAELAAQVEANFKSEVGSLTEQLNKVAAEARVTLEEFEKIQAQREIEREEKENEEIEKGKSGNTLVVVVAVSLIAALGFFGLKLMKKPVNAPAQG